MYGQCEIYGTKSFDFFNWLKDVTREKKGFIEMHKEVDLSLDSDEEEI